MSYAFEPVRDMGCIIRAERNGDPRGWLAEIYNAEIFAAAGVPGFVQDNISRSSEAGTVRGLHFQFPPHQQGKLFRVARGAVFNVAVDLRGPGFGQVDQRVLDDPTVWIYLEPGVAHGVQTLEAEVELHYKLTARFEPRALGALRYDDSALGIAWPITPDRSRLSPRDLAARSLADLEGAF
ncbi:dTDP-4-dehydrorhamnose 3,5-epimerase family protein [Caulobacter sp. Root655]|uniref:dTDP-4-dehydrorhamnose 3,5-epimerase family protein n=1 Tax=Caulobacter sp. Root655 TaxID=1736578 RepID=UPI0012E3849C|nr:dTDP-4-dehydrorhamnose 3,5-epimerase [Caulobacter sp. Root655]